jgi:hypothetical protein
MVKHIGYPMEGVHVVKDALKEGEGWCMFQLRAVHKLRQPFYGPLKTPHPPCHCM